MSMQSMRAMKSPKGLRVEKIVLPELPNCVKLSVA